MNAKRRERRRLAKTQASLGVSSQKNENSLANKPVNLEINSLKSRLAVVKEEKADLKGRPPNGYEKVSQLNSQANEEIKQEKACLKPSKLNSCEPVSLTNSAKIKEVSQEKVSQRGRKQASKKEVSQANEQVSQEKANLKASMLDSYEKTKPANDAETKQVKPKKVSQSIRNQADKDNSQKGREPSTYELNNLLKHSENKQVNPKRAKKLNSRKLSPLRANLPAHSPLRKLIQQWLTFTNYACSPTCRYTYCSNC